MRFDADVDRVLKNFEFHRGFFQTHLRENWKRALDVEAALFRPSRGESLFLTIFTTLELSVRWRIWQQVHGRLLRFRSSIKKAKSAQIFVDQSRLRRLPF